MEEKRKSRDARGTGTPRDGELNDGALQSSDHALSATAASSLDPRSLPDPGIEIANLHGILFPTDGDTSFEEAECIGHNPNLDTLVGTIRVKKSVGSSGEPCQGGSTEYVTFWADLNNNGRFETCIGTTSIEANDYKNLSNRGLECSVFMPANLGMLHHLYQHRDLRSSFLAMLLLLRLL